jgi:hypothetical protein
VSAQDSNGPMLRSARDCAQVLEFMVDPRVAAVHGLRTNYVEQLHLDLVHLRLGFSRDVFNTVDLGGGVVIAPDQVR